MRYLGVEYYWDAYFQIYISEKGNYLGLENMQKDIRKKVLPTYQPTKTVEWLEEQTGVKWLYNNEYKMLSVDCFLESEVYDFKDNTVFKDYSNRVIVDPNNTDGKWVYMPPREFIEKITKGEWV